MERPYHTGLPKCDCGACLFCWHRHQRQLESRARYRARHPQKARAQTRGAYEKRKDYYLERAREWAISNREKSNAIKKAWAQRHPEKQREIERKKNARNNRVRKGVPLDALAMEYAEILRFDPCSYCGGTAGEIDHITPVAMGGKSNWENLTAACKSCNSRKQTRPLLLFLAT